MTPTCRRLRSTRRPVALITGAVVVQLGGLASLAVSHVCAFVNTGLHVKPQVSLARQAAAATAGFGEKRKKTDPEFKRVKVSLEQLRADHGDKAEDVDWALRGQGAKTPEDMVRARFSALRAGDGLFMAKTEIDEVRPTVKQRTKAWLTSLGRREKSQFQEAPSEEVMKLRKIKSFELIAAEGNEVEFKIHCEEGTLHERSIMQEDEKWGWIYSGEAKSLKWE
eukprot:TRINITY_DN89894_c0_g1_i1.p1 TRINITY_DN89894_c0_g1~~TRINITY_DN89894_c0_g1_i1.p1  ORF type:complete len:223 (-),score=51.31 TRINITY_DN89894_c0_g1_i1:33-701(-)